MKSGTLFGIIALCGALGTSYATGNVVVSQKGRAFAPLAVEISRGDTVTITNDDEFLHHAYVDAPGFKYDSGGQEIGSSTPVRFTQSGTFEVRCAIHPKMKLSVAVQ